MLDSQEKSDLLGTWGNRRFNAKTSLVDHSTVAWLIPTSGSNQNHRSGANQTRFSNKKWPKRCQKETTCMRQGAAGWSTRTPDPRRTCKIRRRSPAVTAQRRAADIGIIFLSLSFQDNTSWAQLVAPFE
jgi:hypothetical protein